MEEKCLLLLDNHFGNTQQQQPNEKALILHQNTVFQKQPYIVLALGIIKILPNVRALGETAITLLESWGNA